MISKPILLYSVTNKQTSFIVDRSSLQIIRSRLNGAKRIKTSKSSYIITKTMDDVFYMMH